MLFSQDELWPPVELSALRFVDIQTAPQGWVTNESHFIVFQAPDDPTPMWCSDPTPGIALSMGERAERHLLPPALAAEEVLALIEEAARRLGGSDERRLPGFSEGYVSRLPGCFTLMEFQRVPPPVQEQVAGPK